MMTHPVLEQLHRYGISAEIQFLDASDSRPFYKEEINDHFIFYLNPARYKDTEAALYYLARLVVLPRLIIETERLILRHFQKGDAENLFEAMSDKESCYLDGGYEPVPVMDEKYIQNIDEYANDPTRFVIALKDSNQAIGTITVMNIDDRQVEAKELGYLINPSQRRKGYAYEAVSAMIHVLQDEFKLDLILIGACEKNKPSLAMIEKLGFTFEGKKRKAFWDAELKQPADLLYFYKDYEQERTPC